MEMGFITQIPVIMAAKLCASIQAQLRFPTGWIREISAFVLLFQIRTDPRSSQLINFSILCVCDLWYWFCFFGVSGVDLMDSLSFVDDWSKLTLTPAEEDVSWMLTTQRWIVRVRCLDAVYLVN